MILICTVPWNAERYQWAQELRDYLPEARLIEDREHNGYETFQRALEAQGSEDAWHLQDDAVLTSRWLQKARWERATHPDTVIQGFSRRCDDLTVGSRWMNARGFNYGICWFLPGRLAPGLLAFSRTWPRRPPVEKCSLDTMTADYLATVRERYWLVVPSLVQHREGPSMVDGRRARARQSKTFRP